MGFCFDKMDVLIKRYNIFGHFSDHEKREAKFSLKAVFEENSADDD
jgi:hypothetical protein